jgi:hypothetical protein
MKVVAVSLIVISLLAWAFWSPTDVAVVDPTPIAKPVVIDNRAAITTTPSSKVIPQVKEQTTSAVIQDDKSHLDYLSPEMKQAVKDKLFHHGPKTITKDSQGRIRLDHAGRYVNMPVAVRKADGSIEIKEYSVVPETHTEVTK